MIELFSEKYLKKLIKKLIGNNDIEDALKRLDRLTQEEARMASAQLLNITTAIDERVAGIDDKVKAVMDGARYIFYRRIVQPITRLDGKEAREVIQQAAGGVDRIERSWFSNRIHAGHGGSIILTGNQLQQDLRRWLSPPDPSTNHNTACNAHHKGTATWFFEGRTYKEWKSTGSESLLWIHGKRMPQSRFAA